MQTTADQPAPFSLSTKTLNHLQSGLEKLAKQFDNLCDKDLDDPETIKSLIPLARVIRDTSKILTPPLHKALKLQKADEDNQDQKTVRALSSMDLKPGSFIAAESPVRPTPQQLQDAITPREMQTFIAIDPEKMPKLHEQWFKMTLERFPDIPMTHFYFMERILIRRLLERPHKAVDAFQLYIENNNPGHPFTWHWVKVAQAFSPDSVQEESPPTWKSA